MASSAQIMAEIIDSLNKEIKQCGNTREKLIRVLLYKRIAVNQTVRNYIIEITDFDTNQEASVVDLVNIPKMCVKSIEMCIDDPDKLKFYSGLTKGIFALLDDACKRTTEVKNVQTQT